jgi:hypothetical protein
MLIIDFHEPSALTEHENSRDVISHLFSNDVLAIFMAVIHVAPRHPETMKIRLR